MSDPTLRLFGTPALQWPDGSELVLAAERQFQLLAYLACRADWVRRDELAEWLWPDRAPSMARSNLRKVLLLAQRIPALPPLEHQGDRLRWAPASDLQRFDAACAEQRHADALALCTGPLLQGIEAGLSPVAVEWLGYERERTASRWRAAAVARLGELEREPAEAAAVAEAMLRRDPYDETALAALVQARRAMGDPAAARHELEAHARRLGRELGLEPSAGLRALAADAEAKVREQLPPAARPLPDFVGRRLELAQIGELLLDEQRRVVTVIGPGGVGKSCIARTAMSALQERFADGCVWLPLQDLARAEEVPARLAASIGLELASTEGPWAQIERHLAGRQTLLVVDNAEDLGGSLCEPFAGLLAACPRVALLVTSRRRLGLRAECLLPLEGLPLPDADEGDVEVLRRNDAIRLFEARARNASHAFQLAPQAAEAVRLVHAVEGLPLAIELAAAWVRLLPVRDIVAELARSLDVLEAPGDAPPSRDRSLRASFEHSWRLLPPPERAALVALALLPGPFDRDMARQVAGASLPLLAGLADKSLLRPDEGGRFSLHPLLRSCAQEKLAETSVDAAAQQARHAAFLGHWLSPFENRYRLQGRDAKEALEPMLPHLRAAWQWAIDAGEAALAARFAAIVPEFFRLRGQWDEGVGLLRRAVARFEAGDTHHQRARLQSMVELGALLYHGRNVAEAEETLRRALRLAARARHGNVVTRGLLTLGNCVIDQGRTREARPLFERAWRQAERDGDAALVAVARVCLGTLALLDVDLDRAQAHFEAAAPALAACGHHDGQAAAIMNIGNVQFERGAFAAALRDFEEALALCNRHELESTRPYALVNIGLAQAELGLHDDALHALEDALGQARRHGEPLVEAQALGGLARRALSVGQPSLARRHLRAALTVAKAADLLAVQLTCVRLWAELLAAEGDFARAAAVMQWLARRQEAEPADRRQAAAWLAARAPANAAVPAWTVAEVVAMISSQGSRETLAKRTSP